MIPPLLSLFRVRASDTLFSMSPPFKTKFLLAALPDVPFDGWTPALMARTARRLKLSEDKIAAAFPGGVQDLVAHFSDWTTDEMLARLKKQDLAALRVRDRITLGVRTRLEILGPYKQAVAAALAFLARPPHSLRLPRLVWQVADRIWWTAGDTATDYNHYTKRALLAGVLSATTLYWINDTSRGHEQTWKFLDRRIDNVLKIGQKLSSFKKRTEG